MAIATPNLDAAPEPVTRRSREYSIQGEKLVNRVRELVHEGTVRRITVKHDDGTVLMEIPLTVGVVGAVLVPVWAALGAIAALAARYRIAVEHAPVRQTLEPPRVAPHVFHCRDDV